MKLVNSIKNNLLLKVIIKFIKDNVIEGHFFHWICLISIIIVCILGNCYQIYHSVIELSRNVSDIDIAYVTNFSVPSITMCFPVIALLNTECLKHKNPKIIKKFESMFPKHKGNNLLKDLYAEIVKTQAHSRLILNEFYLNDLYTCLDRPIINMVNSSYAIINIDSISESFKSDLFCMTFNFDKKFIDKEILLKKRIMKNFFELSIQPTTIKYNVFCRFHNYFFHEKFFLHDASDKQNDYLLWYFKLIKLDITEKDYKNIFGFTYRHFINILEDKCLENGQISYHYSKEKFSTPSHLKEDCISQEFISLLRYPFGESRLPVEFIFNNPKLKLKLYKPDKATFMAMNLRHNFSRLIDNCCEISIAKACRTSIFIPELKYSFRRDRNENITLALIPPDEPDLDVKSAPRLSTFEFSIFIMSVICSWLQFSLFGFIYSLIKIKKKLNEIEFELKKEN